MEALHGDYGEEVPTYVGVGISIWIIIAISRRWAI